MILGIGTDLVEINAMKRAVSGSDRFIRRVFTKTEIDYCENRLNKYQHYAARFAAKEAVFKAFGCGWRRGIKWKDIEIVRHEGMPPEITLYGRMHELADHDGIKSVHLSLSHTENYAVATVVMET